MDSGCGVAAIVSCVGAGTSSHITDLIDFVQTYRWIWDIKMTDFFVKQWWNHFPNEVI